MLLHVGDALVQRTFDPWVGVLAALLFLAAALVIWTPRAARKRTARRLGSVAVAITVALALLPSVLPYDHLFMSQPAHADSGQVHQDHCHGAPGSCSDAPVSSGAGQFLTAEPLLKVPALTAVLMVVVAAGLIGVSFRPTLRPPAESFVTI